MTSATRSRVPPTLHRGGRWQSICLLSLLSLAAADPVAAQKTGAISVAQDTNGFVAQVPSDTTYSRRCGLRLEVDTRWPNNYGYRPVGVRVRAAKPTTAEHRITIRLSSAAWDRRDVSVEQDFDMPLGATEAEAVVTCPQFQSEHRYWWDVWVDGVREKELCLDQAASWNVNATGNSSSTTSVIKFLIVGTPAGSQPVIGVGAEVFEAFSLGLDELPTRWIDYSAIDVITLSPSDLRQLANTRPEALTALRRWIRTGGQMWVHPLGERWQRLGEVEQLLEITPPPAESAAPAADEAEAAVAARGWKPIVLGPGSAARRVTVRHIPTGSTRILRDPAEIARLKLDPDYIITEEPAPATVSDEADEGAMKLADSAKWYIQRPAGLGYVRVFRRAWDPVGFSISWRMLVGAASDQVPPTPTTTTPLTAAIETTKNWQSRHGNSPDFANEDFANLLVPGVGLAPVTEFRALITVFVLVIGPLNYWLLKRANRLHLMLLTVPLVAFGLTSALFAYALVSDGLSTTVRVRSFTTLDQHTGEAACWARLSYYAGLAPGRGLLLPDDVALYPIIPGWNQSADNASLDFTREMEWIDGKQLLTQGWLRSRVPTQYLSVRARKSPHRIRFARAGERLAATNELGTRINFVAAIDLAGNVFTGEAIADRASTLLNASTHSDALRHLRQLVTENQPETPPALEDDRSGFAQSQRRGRRRMLQQRFDLEYGPERLADNLQSTAIAALVELGTKPMINVPFGSFVAVTQAGPEVDFGVAGAEEQASFHVMVGNW